MSPDVATWAFYLAGALYALTTVVLLANLVGIKHTVTPAWAAALLTAAAIAHATLLGFSWKTHGIMPLGGIRPALSTLALGIVIALLVARRSNQRVQVVGAFVTPLVLLILAASHSPDQRPTGPLGDALLALHIGSVTTATAVFTLAFATAVSYLIQEHQVKRKRLGGVFQRLPALDELDQLGYRCVALGLPALTLGVVTGLLVGARSSNSQNLMATWQQYVGIGVWLLFAAVLVLRLAAGWRGRRAAFGTILGYASTVVILAGYYLRT
jgi:ABC-type uncharacterized transport system permease subunit